MCGLAQVIGGKQQPELQKQQQLQRQKQLQQQMQRQLPHLKLAKNASLRWGTQIRFWGAGLVSYCEFYGEGKNKGRSKSKSNGKNKGRDKDRGRSWNSSGFCEWWRGAWWTRPVCADVRELAWLRWCGDNAG